MDTAPRRRQWYPLAIGLAIGALFTGLVLPWAVEPADGERDVALGAAGDATSADGSLSGGNGTAWTTTDTSGALATGPSGSDAPGATAVGTVAQPGPSASPGSPLTASDVGVTATSIKVGVLIADLGAVGRFGFSFDTGDAEAQFRVFVDGLNERGGINGRTIEPVYQHFDVTSTDSMHAACLALTEDHKVFAVVSSGGFFGPPVLCVTRDHHTPLLVSIDSSPQDYYTQSGGFLFTEMMNKHRILAVLAGELDRMNALRGHKIGIVDADLPADKSAVDGGLVPALERLGYAVTRRETLAGDASVAASQMPVAVQQLRAAGVDVLLTPMNIVYTALFVREADRQGYRPTYFGSDFAQGSTDFLLTTMPDSYEGTLAFTSMRTGEHRTPAPEAGADAACRATYEKATGTSLERGSGPYQSTLSACGLVQQLEAGAKAAGSQLTRNAFSGALRQQRGFSMPWFIGTGSFGPAKFDAADSIRTVRADMGCKCWLPASDPRQARF